MHTLTTLLQWINHTGSPQTDGFEVKRLGDTNLPVKIFLFPKHEPERFRVSKELEELLGISIDTKSNILCALWRYIKVRFFFSRTSDSR